MTFSFDEVGTYDGTHQCLEENTTFNNPDFIEITLEYLARYQKLMDLPARGLATAQLLKQIFEEVGYNKQAFEIDEKTYEIFSHWIGKRDLLFALSKTDDGYSLVVLFDLDDFSAQIEDASELFSLHFNEGTYQLVKFDAKDVSKCFEELTSALKAPQTEREEVTFVGCAHLLADNKKRIGAVLYEGNGEVIAKYKIKEPLKG